MRRLRVILSVGALVLASASVSSAANAQVRFYAVLDDGVGMTPADLAILRAALVSELDANAEIDVAPLGQAPATTDAIIAGRHRVGLDISWTVVWTRPSGTIRFGATVRERGSSEPRARLSWRLAPDGSDNAVALSSLTAVVPSLLPLRLLRVIAPGPRAAPTAPSSPNGAPAPTPPTAAPIPPAEGDPEFRMLEPRTPT